MMFGILALLFVIVLVTTEMQSTIFFANYTKSMVNPLAILHAMVLTIGGIVIISVLLAVLGIKNDILTKLSSKPLLLLGLPGAIGLVDLMTIIQGFTGLASHYKYFKYLAFSGIVISILGFISVLSFAVVAMRTRIPRRSLGHWLLGIGISFTLGCIVMYATAEAAGFWYSRIHKEKTSGVMKSRLDTDELGVPLYGENQYLNTG